MGRCDHLHLTICVCRLFYHFDEQGQPGRVDPVLEFLNYESLSPFSTYGCQRQRRKSKCSVREGLRGNPSFKGLFMDGEDDFPCRSRLNFYRNNRPRRQLR